MRLLASSLIAVALLVGCGGESSSGSSSPTTSKDPELEQRVADFNEMLRKTKPEWRFSFDETVARFLRSDLVYDLIFEEGYKDPVFGVIATSPDLEDDSVRQERYELGLVKSDADGWTIVSATRTFKCQPNRGHQDFSAELCL